MLFKSADVDGIKRGEITLAFRRWKRPTVKVGGTLRIPDGVLAIEAVDVIRPADISDRDAKRAGRTSKDELLAELAKYPDGDLYRIRFRLKGGDERVELRENTDLSKAEMSALLSKLTRFDRETAWTRKVLKAIDAAPGKRAADLAAKLGYETLWFKTHVRKLKALGLTESLEVGYRLSPRGRKVLKQLD